jgi:hypothetical protein
MTKLFCSQKTCESIIVVSMVKINVSQQVVSMVK